MKYKIIVLKQTINDTYNRSFRSDNVVTETDTYYYVVADRLVDISYNEASIFRKYENASEKNIYERKHPALQIDFNNPIKWKQYCGMFHVENHSWYDEGVTQDWTIAHELSLMLIDELSSFIPEKYELFDAEDIDFYLNNGQWKIVFLTRRIEKVYNEYLIESRKGCQDIQNSIWNNRIKITELENSIKTIKESIVSEEKRLKDQERNNLIRLLCEKKLYYDTAFPPTIGFENVPPSEIAICSGNKHLFVSFYEQGLFNSQDDVLCLFLKYGLFQDYHRLKNSFKVYSMNECEYNMLHIFYSVFYLNIEEMKKSVKEYGKNFVLSFFNHYYTYSSFENNFLTIIGGCNIQHLEIRQLIWNDYTKKCDEWACDSVDGNEQEFIYMLEDMKRFLKELYGRDQIYEYPFRISCWFNSRLEGSKMFKDMDEYKKIVFKM